MIHIPSVLTKWWKFWLSMSYCVTCIECMKDRNSLKHCVCMTWCGRCSRYGCRFIGHNATTSLRCVHGIVQLQTHIAAGLRVPHHPPQDQPWRYEALEGQRWGMCTNAVVNMGCFKFTRNVDHLFVYILQYFTLYTIWHILVELEELH